MCEPLSLHTRLTENGKAKNRAPVQVEHNISSIKRNGSMSKPASGRDLAGRLFKIDVERMTKRASDFGFRVATPAELAAGVAISEALMGKRIAPLEVVSRIQAQTGVSTWVTGVPVDGFFLFVPLSAEGVRAVRTGTYIPAQTKLEELALKGSECCGVYVGVCAGASHDARRNVMTVSAVMRVELFASVPCFSRAATSDGARAMLSLGFRPVLDGQPDMYVQEALAGHEVKAA